MKLQPIKTHLVVKQDPVVFKKQFKNVANDEKVNRPNKGGMNYLA